MKVLYLLSGLLLSAFFTKAQTCSTTISTFPHTQNFETTSSTGNLPTGWETTISSIYYPYRWKLNAGPTPTPASGPNVDHTLGTAAGKYLYTDATFDTEGAVTELTSPCINLSGLTSPGFEFWFHRAGLAMGRMDIQVSNNNGVTWSTVYTLNGAQQTLENDPWQKRTITLGAYSNQTVIIKFKATKLLPPIASTTIEGDMAIDDIKFFSIPPVDLEMAAITAPIVQGCGFSAAETISIAIKNNGNIPTSSFQVSYQIGSNTPVQETANLVITPGATATYSFSTKANLSIPGTYPITVSAIIPADADAGNNTTTKSIQVLNAVPAFPYFENFEAGNGGWTSGGRNSSWALGKPVKNVMTSAASGTNCWVTNLTNSQFSINEMSYVLGPCFNFSALSVPVISMKIWWNAETHNDGAVLQSSIDGGVTWQRVGNFGDPYNWYNDSAIVALPGGQKNGWTGVTGNLNSNGSNGWVLAKHRLDGLGGKASVQLRIAFNSNSSSSTQDEGFAFDDVRIFQAPANDLEVLAITGPSVRSCGFTTTETVSITIKNFGSVATSSFPVSYQIGTNPPVQETANLIIAPEATATYTFTTKANLAAPGTYVITAQTLIPADGEPANNSQTKTVHSVPVISTYPYSENFETSTAGWVAGGTNSSWAWGTPNKLVIKNAASGTKAWVTNLTGQYNALEQSYVMGPCFNFSAVAAPIIALKIWWSSSMIYDGTVLQSSIDGGATWQRVGNVGDPNNWYNQNAINGSPGVGPINNPAPGWAGLPGTGNSSNGWVFAKHALTGLGGQPSVLLRIAFGSHIFRGTDGFAFDDISIFDVSANELEMVAITLPVVSGCGLTATETVTVSIKNNGITATSSFPVSYQIGTNAPVQETANVVIAPNATGTYSFTTKANLAAPGAYIFTAKTLVPGDAIPENDTQIKTITHVPTIATFPYFEDFENGAGNWLSTGTNSSWALGTPAKPTLTTAASGTNAWVTKLTGNYNINENSAVVSPCFNFSAISNPAITLKIWWNTEIDYDGAVLQSSIDGGTTWQKVGTFGDPNNWYNTHDIQNTPGGVTADSSGWAGHSSYGNNSKGWLLAKHALTGLGGKPSVKLRIAFASDALYHYEGVAFDEVRIYQLAPNDLELVSINTPIGNGCGFTATETVCISIKNNGTAATTSFPVKYQIGSNPPVQETANLVIAPGATATYCFTTKANLAAAGTYNLTVTTLIPGDGYSSDDAKTTTFTLLPTIATFPYTEGFENGAGGWTSGGVNSSWALGTPAKTIINSAAAGTKAWVTNLTGNYNGNEVSYVQSPCFNFSGIPDPYFEMKIWWTTEPRWDGAVLQSSIDGGATWQKVGTAGRNWYNDTTAHNWSGNLNMSSGSNSWVKVRHKLTGLGGQSGVKLRIAFITAGFYVYDEGVAFDEIRIIDNTNNLTVNAITPISKPCGFSATEPITAVLENLGSAPVSGFTVSYTLNSGAPVTQPFTGTLAPGVPTNFTFTQPANLSAAIPYTIVVTVNMPGDPEAANNSATYTVSNAAFTSLPPVFTFETPVTGITALHTATNLRSNISEDIAASVGAGSSKGMIMDGVDNLGWLPPVNSASPWTNNPENFAGAYFCFDPRGGNPADSLVLTFDLKQLFKGINASTNFRVTVNGNQIGTTYRPPFSGGPIVWQKIRINLTSFKNLSSLQIGLESNVKEAFANGTGTANLIDNIRIYRAAGPTGIKSALLEKQISVYPNPSNGEFKVNLPANETYLLEICDLTGKVIQRQKATGNTQVKLESKAKGIYLLKVSNDGATAVRKLVVE